MNVPHQIVVNNILQDFDILVMLHIGLTCTGPQQTGFVASNVLFGSAPCILFKIPNNVIIWRHLSYYSNILWITVRIVNAYTLLECHWGLHCSTRLTWICICTVTKYIKCITSNEIICMTYQDMIKKFICYTSSTIKR